MTCDQVMEAGVYLLGALPPDERAAFEAHLVGCPTCRREVTDLAGLPGLMRRLTPEAAERLLADPAGAPSDHPEPVPGAERPPAPADDRIRPPGHRPVLTPVDPLPAEPVGSAGPVGDRLQPPSRWRRGGPRGAAGSRVAGRRRGALLAAGSVAAALALVVAVLVGLRPDRSAPPPQAGPSLAAMHAVGAGGPLTAQIGLTGFEGGTRITMHCRYAEVEHGNPWTLRLYVYGRTGPPEPAGSWTAGPGEDVRVDAVSRFAPPDIARVELRRADGTVVLAYAP